MVSLINPSSGITSVGDQGQGNSIQQLGGGMPPGAMFFWNGQLTECSIQAVSGSYQSYGKVSFPVHEVTTSFSQDIVQHKRPNVAGAQVESLGSNPVVFKIKAPFLYGLQRGNGETWSDLFPQTFAKVIQILNDQVSPIVTFTHPTMGQFTCKPQSASTATTGEMRNGQVIEFELVTTNELNNSLSSILTANAFNAAASAATLFDQQIVQLQPPPPSNITSINLTQLLQQVRGAIDQTTLFINRFSSVFTNAIYQIGLIEQSLDRLNTAATAGLKMQLQRVKSGLYALTNNTDVSKAPQSAIALRISQVNQSQNNKLNTNNTSLGIYVVPIEMTLANVALTLQNTIDQLIQLNPSICKTPTLLPGTQVVFNANTTAQSGAARSTNNNFVTATPQVV